MKRNVRRVGKPVLGGRRFQRERGAALVEFALIVPLLSMFLFGIVQFGLAYDAKQSINSAAREGARTGAIPINTVSDVEAAVSNSFQTLGSGASPDVEVTRYDPATMATTAPIISGQPCDGHEGETVIVRASVPHTITIPFFGVLTPTLTGEGEFRCERTP